MKRHMRMLATNEIEDLIAVKFYRALRYNLGGLRLLMSFDSGVWEYSWTADLGWYYKITHRPAELMDWHRRGCLHAEAMRIATNARAKFETERDARRREIEGRR